MQKQKFKNESFHFQFWKNLQMQLMSFLHECRNKNKKMIPFPNNENKNNFPFQIRKNAQVFSNEFPLQQENRRIKK